ncbi:uncharacterized protein SCODWIG_00852 [Saccharomycodes ludwigii]|uniref:Conserved oligomeric Golgi complex subunit 8 n=1 Tax=Saccharomycodes ludwigii TaxID=36035 RepID=A0A376B362_9ASCO|nr:hypothetical protein SCDLUD_002171 [Saccharomycodes ludwigii]KAH3902351.1 hypothetical protein SCDLUD_002171 [Saccharomycodes ludwigii]SSD59091.1 uncharacterized protein SCODWIG_00852 [Saccharomycodes ludwigii]
MEYLIEELGSYITKNDECKDANSPEIMTNILKDILTNCSSTYFTSTAPLNRGTANEDSHGNNIVNEIAEVENLIFNKEKVLKKELIKNREVILDECMDYSKLVSINDLQLALKSCKEEKEKKKDENSRNINEMLSIFKNKNNHYNNDNNINISFLLENLDLLNNKILEIPMVLSICIKTGHYNEALLLQQHVKKILLSRYNGSEIIQEISKILDNEVQNTMLYGLVRILSTCENYITIKKILKILSNIEKDDDDDNDDKRRNFYIGNRTPYLFLIMRFKYIQQRLSTIGIFYDNNNISDNINQVRRRIDVIREDVYTTLNIFVTTFNNDELLETDYEVYLLEFTNNTLNEMLNFVKQKDGKTVATTIEFFTEGVLLQLIYCSYRLGDINPKFNWLMLNKIKELNIYTTEQLANAIRKRNEMNLEYGGLGSIGIATE